MSLLLVFSVVNENTINSRVKEKIPAIPRRGDE